MNKIFIFFLMTFGIFSQVSSLPLTDNEVDTEDDSLDLSQFGTSIYGQPDEAAGEKLKSWTPNQGNPEEMGTYAEGDILMPSEQQGRNGMSAETYRWKNGTIPYIISGNFNPFQLNMIEEAFNEYHKKTCIKFIYRTFEPDYISIENSQTGCWSSVGRVGGKQVVNLQTPSCMTKVGTTIHELLHAVGFLHEQNRSDRDEHVFIQWYNIPKNVKNNFDKADASSTTAFDVPYDYGSVMHYSANAFSNNGQDTIVALKPGGEKMGQREGLSESDITKIQKMYKCEANNQETTQAPNPGPAPATAPTTAAPAPQVISVVEPHVGETIYEKIDALLKKIGKGQEKNLVISIETKLDDKF